ncbi:hypothetical protein P7C71_g4313, partial [Lecanoromycetidae sp. Uapishka_2]
MLSDDSPFLESSSKINDKDSVQMIRFPDDDCASMKIIMNILHHQGHKVPVSVLIETFYAVATLCDKYDLSKSLRPWAEQWSQVYEFENSNYGGWLFIATVFKLVGVFSEITKNLIINTSISNDKDGTFQLSFWGSTEFSEGVPQSVLASARVDLVTEIQVTQWEQVLKLRDRDGYFGCKNTDVESEAEDCGAINLGLLTQKLPNLRDPLDAVLPTSSSAASLVQSIENIKNLDEMTTLSEDFTRFHQTCNIASILRNEAECIMEEVEGLQLESVPCQPIPAIPAWLNAALTGFTSRHRGYQVEAVMQCVHVGGSLGGLFAAIVLKRLGHAVRIFERNPTPLLHNQGAGVVAGGDTQAFFTKFDATKRPIAVTSRLRQYLDLQGNQIHEEGTVQKMTSWDLLYYLLRANFDGVKSEYCQVPEAIEGERQGIYEYGHLVRDVKDRGEKVEIEFDNREGNRDSITVDLVIGADGPSSTLRKSFLPDVERKYVGYVAWRGTVPESAATSAAQRAFIETFTFYHSAGIQILSYVIPGENGSLEPGKRLINWVWYCNYPQDSSKYKELLTDADGKHHHITLPIGKMRKQILEKQREYARKVLPPQFADIVCDTKEPFIQSITDVISPRNSFFDGKVLLLGDAVAGFRPHTAASTSQAAFDAEKLYEMMSGEISMKQWEEETMEYARHMQSKGVSMGQRSQFGQHPLAQMNDMARS